MTNAMLDFCAWLGRSRPGEVYTYHTGFLARDRWQNPELPASNEAAELDQLAKQVAEAAEMGFILLVQQQVAPEVYEYLTIRSSEIME